jgi:hypothetical protein
MKAYYFDGEMGINVIEKEVPAKLHRRSQETSYRNDRKSF